MWPVPNQAYLFDRTSLKVSLARYDTHPITGDSLKRPKLFNNLPTLYRAYPYYGISSDTNGYSQELSLTAEDIRQHYSTTINAKVSKIGLFRLLDAKKSNLLVENKDTMTLK